SVAVEAVRSDAPFWLEVVAHDPIKVIDHEWRAIDPGRPFKVLARDGSFANHAAGVSLAYGVRDVLRGLGYLQPGRQLLDLFAKSLHDHGHGSFERVRRLRGAAGVREQLIRI